jgi:8-oxo-dGTP diphosphatase
VTEAPDGYDQHVFPPFAVTVDVVVLTIAERELQVVLVERGGEPYAGVLALPGGFVQIDEDLDAAAARELAEETGVRVPGHLEQVGAYGDPDRDPRMRVVSVAYLAVVRDVGPITAGSDATGAALHPVADVLGRRPRLRLAFDHRRILGDAVERARADLETTSLATAFVGPEFTLSELRQVYEAAWGTQLDPGNFRRKLLSEPGILRPTGKRVRPGPEGGKPAETYRAPSAPLPFAAPLRRPRDDR